MTPQRRSIRLKIAALISLLAVIGPGAAGAQEVRGPPSKIDIMPHAANGVDPVVEFSKGVIALNAGQYDIARAALEKATQGAPEHYDSWGFLGAARAGLGDWAGSKAAYEQMVRIEPNSAHGHAGLALALAALKENAKVTTELEWLDERLKMCVGKCTDRVLLRTMIPQIRKVMAGGAAPRPMAGLQGQGRAVAVGRADA